MFPFRVRMILRSALLSATALLAVAVPGWSETVQSTPVVVSGDGGGTQPSPWTLGEDLIVGETGTGTLTIADGGVVSNSDGLIGSDGASDGAVTVTGAGSIWENAGGLLVGRNGAGTLNIEDGGAVSNIDGYIGAFVQSDGTVSVTGTGSTWENRGNLYVGHFSTGTLTIADGGVVKAALSVVLGDYGESNGTLNIGAAAGHEAEAAGTLLAKALTFVDGTGKVVFNHTGTAYQFAPVMSGIGSVAVHAGTTALTGNHSYTGGTEIMGGQLAVNGAITGATSVTGSGTLGGSGQVGTVTVGSGGTFAPGDSIGTIRAGNTAFNAGSHYAVEVNADGDSDLLLVTGTVTIDPAATLNITSETLGEDGSTYASSTDYTIITASGGVTGTFGTVTDSFAFLDAGVSYDPNSVHLALTRNGTALEDMATSPNQTAMANALDSLGSGSTLYDAVVLLEEDEIAEAYDSISGEAHASVTGARLQNDVVIAETILDNMPATSRRGLAPAVSRGTPAASRDTWAAVFGFRAETADTGNAASMDRSGGGAVAGVDLVASPDLHLGVTLGVSGSEYGITDRQSSGTARAAHLGVYGSTGRGPVNLRFGATYSYHEIESARRVAVGAMTDELTASYNAQSAALFAEASYGLGPVEPFVNANYSMLELEAFTESGGAAALLVDAASQEVIFATLGVRAAHDIMLGSNHASLSGSVAWQHADGDLASQLDVAFDGSERFRIEGAPLATDTAVITTELEIELGASTSIGFGYSGQLSEDTQRHTLQASLTKSF